MEKEFSFNLILAEIKFSQENIVFQPKIKKDAGISRINQRLVSNPKQQAQRFENQTINKNKRIEIK